MQQGNIKTAFVTSCAINTSQSLAGMAQCAAKLCTCLSTKPLLAFMPCRYGIALRQLDATPAAGVPQHTPPRAHRNPPPSLPRAVHSTSSMNCECCRKRCRSPQTRAPGRISSLKAALPMRSGDSMASGTSLYPSSPILRRGCTRLQFTATAAAASMQHAEAQRYVWRSVRQALHAFHDVLCLDAQHIAAVIRKTRTARARRPHAHAPAGVLSASFLPPRRAACV